jgi:nucleoporin POM152
VQPHLRQGDYQLPLEAEYAMNGTPRLRSAFPSTPSSRPKAREHDVSKSEALPLISTSSTDVSLPLVPFSVVDAPSQRFYIALLYLGLTIWRLYDFSMLVVVETDSLWLFMKWVAIDSAFLYGLPALRVPWLQWSSSTITILFLMHGALNAALMFRVSVS